VQLLVAYASLSHAHRVRRLLYDRGRFVEMVRTPQQLAARGCGFGLHCSEAEMAAVRSASQEARVEIRGVFRVLADGYEALP
jgi:hypothetical protein